MKRMIMAFAALVMMSSVTMAQKNDTTKAARPNRTEIIKKRTEAVAQRYGLNEEQKAKLLELNSKYDGRMRMGAPGRGNRQMRPVMREPMRKADVKGDSLAGRPAKADGGKRMKRPVPRRPMANGMQQYNEELKTIMTEEQYTKYQADMQKRFERQNTRKDINKKGATKAPKNSDEK